MYKQPKRPKRGIKELIARRHIPKNTPYCYKRVGDYQPWGFYVKRCRYYKYETGLIGTCKLYNCEVVDSCKVCGVNEGF